ncbi:MAG: hypothetical protein EOO14_16885 [Chitinophagaceae bacterium]|nr:MAG: hypothetical protein EOO14_16885 [Chitinophagaceae bacterium]
MELTRPAGENNSHSLIGKRVLHVTYTPSETVTLSSHQSYQTDQPEVHRVDRLIRLHISGQSAIEISWNTIKIHWDEEFLNYGIKARLVAAEAPTPDEGWNVSAVDFWQDVVGQDITGFAVYNQKTWVESPKTGVPMDFSYPKTIAVSFANAKTVFFSVAEYQPGHRYTVVRGINSLVVTTSAAAVALPG